jgi:hypothetical protein
MQSTVRSQNCMSALSALLLAISTTFAFAQIQSQNRGTSRLLLRRKFQSRTTHLLRF